MEYLYSFPSLSVYNRYGPKELVFTTSPVLENRFQRTSMINYWDCFGVGVVGSDEDGNEALLGLVLWVARRGRDGMMRYAYFTCVERHLLRGAEV